VSPSHLSVFSVLLTLPTSTAYYRSIVREILGSSSSKVVVANPEFLVYRVWENERAFRTDAEINETLLRLWNIMDGSIHAGISSSESAPLFFEQRSFG
jgi:hypothetical protein